MRRDFDRLLLEDMSRLAEQLSREFYSLSYDAFAHDETRVESAVMRLLVLREGWSWLPDRIRQRLIPIDWLAVTGKWDEQKARRVGIDSGKLWSTIVNELPQMSRQIEEVCGSKTSVG